MKVILRFKISGETSCSQETEKPARDDGSQKISGAVSECIFLLISFFKSTYYDGNNIMQKGKSVMENVLCIKIF